MKLPTQFVKSLGRNRLPGQIATDFTLLNQEALVFRQITLDLFQKLQNSTNKHKPVILDGGIGLGKSVELLKLASLASSQGHLVIYASNTNSWVDSSQAYFPNVSTQLYSQWSIVSAFLKSIRSINSQVLDEINVDRDVTVGKVKFNTENTLASVVDLGIKTPSLAHECFELFLDVAREQAKIPVLVAIDQINTFYSKTLYTDQEHQILDAKSLRLINSLLPFVEGSKQLVSRFSNHNS